jgi:pyridoxamine 5'-phosphate oxidase
MKSALFPNYCLRMTNQMVLAGLRKDYTLRALDLEGTAPDPFTQFGQWMDEALRAAVPEPTAMHLGTVSPDGRPAGRIVLLKGLDADGFTFFTNYDSRKGRHLAGSPFVSLTFFWPELERQVRVEGVVRKVSGEASDEYFRSRPRASRIGALASPQSQVIPDRRVLEEKVETLNAQYGEGADIERPAHWGGYVVTPDAVEFWQGRPSRLHDRILYTRNATGAWQKSRLAP